MVDREIIGSAFPMLFCVLFGLLPDNVPGSGFPPLWGGVGRKPDGPMLLLWVVSLPGHFSDACFIFLSCADLIYLPLSAPACKHPW